jgi:hypothetical protein
VTGVRAVAASDGPVAGLLLPVDGPVRVTLIAAEFAPGSWRWPVRWTDTVDGHWMVWCGERRNVRDLPANTTAWMLAARLGCPDLADRIGLNGDLLIAGIDPDERVGDVPDVVVRAARRAGVLDQSAPNFPHPGDPARVGALWAGRV